VLQLKLSVPIQIIHYSKLAGRRTLITKYLSKISTKVNWVTEKNHIQFLTYSSEDKKPLGMNEKVIGMDLGVNSRSILKTRRNARIEGWLLFFVSYLSQKRPYSTGSLPSKKRLSRSSYEVQCMHLTALKIGLRNEAEWILVLEDDAVPENFAFEKIEEIIGSQKPKNTWINLNSGAGLLRTASDPKPNYLGLFRIRPAATRCSVAYLVSRDLADSILNEAVVDGIPDWLPIDVFFQAALRKFKAKSFWSDPAIFSQGSETGVFRSSLRGQD
jgi:hypothetical protein